MPTTKTYVMEGMKDCPFCGCDPVVIERATIRVECTGCGLVKWVKSIADAKAFWNKRERRVA